MLEAWCLSCHLTNDNQCLVFRISDIGYLPVPACSAAAALVALVLCRAGLALRADCGGPRPEGHRSLINHMRAHSYN